MLKIYQQSEDIKESVLNDLKVNLENQTVIKPTKKSYAISSVESLDFNDLLNKTDSNEELSDVQDTKTVDSKKKKSKPKKQQTNQKDKTHNHGDPIKKIIEVNNRSFKF